MLGADTRVLQNTANVENIIFSDVWYMILGRVTYGAACCATHMSETTNSGDKSRISTSPALPCQVTGNETGDYISIPYFYKIEPNLC